MPSARMPQHIDTRPSDASTGFRFHQVPWVFIAGVSLVFLASSVHVLAQQSFLPIIAAAIYFLLGILPLLSRMLGGSWERKIYLWSFLSGFLSAAIASLYRAKFSDFQTDAEQFFSLSSSGALGLSITEILSVSEGSLAVLIWRQAFIAMQFIGFPIEHYVGVFLNVLMVATSGVIALKIAKNIYGSDEVRLNNLIKMYSMCGIFWLFSGILMRDSIILLSINVLIYFWVNYLLFPRSPLRIFALIVVSFLALPAFKFMRAEFVFVPFAMLLAGLASLIVCRSVAISKRKLYGLLTLGSAAALSTYISAGDALQAALVQGLDYYSGESADQSNEGSLGMTLVINQIMPVRLLLGSIYLYLFPIPMWSGFQLESSYHFFKSLNVIFIYFLLPLIFLSFRELLKSKLHRNPAILFMAFLFLGFTVAIAGTSLETRHIGVFYSAVFVLALLPDLRKNTVRNNYKKMLSVVFFSVSVIHAMWMILKLLV